MYLFLWVALLNEGGPDGSWGNGIYSDASFNEVCGQPLGECCDGTLHANSYTQHDALGVCTALQPLCQSSTLSMMQTTC